MNETVTLIILDRNSYKEHDALLTCFIKGIGVTTLIAKGANKPTSKYGSLLQPTYVLQALIDLKKGISLFKSASLIKHYKQLETTLAPLAVASFICKVLAINAMDDKYLVDFDTLDNYLSKLNEKNTYTLLTHFLMMLAKKMGVAMYLDGCVICNEQKIVAVSSEVGGFLCQQHAHLATLEHQQVNFYRQLRCLHKATLDQVDLCPYATTTQHVQLYMDLLDETCTIPWKNWQFIQQI